LRFYENIISDTTIGISMLAYFALAKN
jgi:hypothetical protein